MQWSNDLDERIWGKGDSLKRLGMTITFNDLKEIIVYKLLISFFFLLFFQTTPLAIAFLKGHTGIVDFLLSLPKTDINFRNDEGSW